MINLDVAVDKDEYLSDSSIRERKLMLEEKVSRLGERAHKCH